MLSGEKEREDRSETLCCGECASLPSCLRLSIRDLLLGPAGRVLTFIFNLIPCYLNPISEATKMHPVTLFSHFFCLSCFIRSKYGSSHLYIVS